jgi:hypothetical protein
MRAPLAPPRLSPPRKVEAEAQATETRLEMVTPGAARMSSFSFFWSASLMGLPLAAGRGSCQMKRC